MGGVNPIKAITDLVADVIPKPVSNLLEATPFTGFGTYDIQKGRLNVPLTTAQTGTAVRGGLGAVGAANEADSPAGMALAQAAAAAERAALGYGVGSAVFGGADAAGSSALTDQAGNTGSLIHGAYQGGEAARLGLEAPMFGNAAYLGDAAGTAGGLAGAAGGSQLGGFAGAMAANQLASILTPQQGAPFIAGSAAGPASQGLTQSQQQMLAGGGTSDPHKGLAYPFEQRQRNAREDPGIAALYNISEGR